MHSEQTALCLSCSVWYIY